MISKSAIARLNWFYLFLNETFSCSSDRLSKTTKKHNHCLTAPKIITSFLYIHTTSAKILTMCFQNEEVHVQIRRNHISMPGAIGSSGPTNSLINTLLRKTTFVLLQHCETISYFREKCSQAETHSTQQRVFLGKHTPFLAYLFVSLQTPLCINSCTPFESIHAPLWIHSCTPFVRFHTPLYRNSCTPFSPCMHLFCIPSCSLLFHKCFLPTFPHCGGCFPPSLSTPHPYYVHLVPHYVTLVPLSSPAILFSRHKGGLSHFTACLQLCTRAL